MSPTLSEISKIMKQEYPVFIVGAPRSGSSVLYNRLHQHPSFKLSNSKIELSESNIFADPYRAYQLYNSDIVKRQSLAYMVGNEAYYQQFLESTKFVQSHHKRVLAGVKFGRRVANKIKIPSNISRILSWRILLNDCLVQSFFYYAKQARGVKRLLEKTPSHIYYLPEIKTTFPYAKLLFIYRHPIDVFSSLKKRLEVEEKQPDNKKPLNWLRVSPETFSDDYASYMQIAQREQISNPSGFMMFKYEDFTNNPQAIFHRICEFVGEPYKEELITEQNEKKPWLSDPYVFKKITETTKEWKDFIKETDAQLIEDRLYNIMCQLDYPLYT